MELIGGKAKRAGRSRPAKTRADGVGQHQGRRELRPTPEAARHRGLASSRPLLFVVQKHRSRRLHYDFRLEIAGALKSWPVPRGPSLDPAVRRLALVGEDHPLSYRSFEGVIPAGQHGAGVVVVWDAGIFAPIVSGRPCFDRAKADSAARDGLVAGKLSFLLHGRKLRGRWTLISRSGDQWLLLKQADQHADSSRDLLGEDRSVLSGLTIDELGAGRPLDLATSKSLLPKPRLEDGARRVIAPREIAPMLASRANQPFSHTDWLFEPKLDGHRVMVHARRGSPRLLSRRGVDVSDQFPTIVEAFKCQPFGEAVLDGEVVALDARGAPSIESLQNRDGEPSLALVWFGFDLIYLDGYDLRSVPLERRKQLLEAWLVPSRHVRLVEHVFVRGEDMYDAAISQGFVGVVAKRRDSAYESGSLSAAWLEVKSGLTDELVIGGYTAGSEDRARTFDALLMGESEDNGGLRFVSCVGAGFDRRHATDLMSQFEGLRSDRSPFDAPLSLGGRGARGLAGKMTWLRPELVAEIRHAGRGRDGTLRAPVFVRIREDRLASEARVAEPLASPRADPADDRLGELMQAAREAEEQLRQEGERRTVTVEGYEISFTSLDKALWPRRGRQPALRKRDLAIYFAGVAPFMLSHLRNRPLTLIRFPDGIAGQGFYQRHWEHSMPPFVETVSLSSNEDQSEREYILCNNLPTLLWLAQIAALELHTWYSRAEAGARSVDRPDFVVFDLDPDIDSSREKEGDEPELHREGFARTRESAFRLKEILDSLRLPSFVKTTGRTGLHIFVPIEPSLQYESTRALAKMLADHVVQVNPNLSTTEWSLKRRGGRVLVDYSQNARGKTLASIYSPRAHPLATVSMPVLWDELGSVSPTDFTLLTAPERLREVGDLWAGILDARRDVTGLLGTGDAAEEAATTRDS